MFKKLLIAVLMMCAARPLAAQSFDYGFKHLTTDNGLTHDNIYAITKDKQGFMWFGTMNGLNRYDGFQVRAFTNQANDSTSLQHNFITTLVCDDDGYLWVGNEGGLCRYNPHTEQFQPLHFPGKAETTRAQVTRSNSGRIFINRNRHLYELDARRQQVRMLTKLPDEAAYARIMPAANGQLWILIATALYLYNPENNGLKYLMGIDLAHPNGSPGVMNVYTDPLNQSWIGTWESGLYRYTEGMEVPEKVSRPLLPFIVTITADLNYAQTNLLWMSAGYSGLLQLNVKTGRVTEMPKNVQQPWSHNGGRVNTFFRDTLNGILWLGTDFGLEKYDPNTEHFARKMLPSTGVVGQFPSVNAVIRDKTDTSGNTWWIGAWIGGFHKWNRQTDEITSYSHKLHHAEIFDLKQDDDGNIWIAEFKSVQLFNPRTNQWTFIDSFMRKDTVAKKILRLFKDSRGNMWVIPNHNGLFKYDRKTKHFTRINLASVLKAPTKVWVTNLAEDKQGTIWAASYIHTFSIAPDGTIKLLEPKPQPDNAVTNTGASSIAIDKHDNIWLTNYGKLVNISKSGDVLKVYDQRNGLKGTSLGSMVIDQQDQIWICTENSLHRLNPATGHFRYYRKEDGLFSNNLTEPMTLADNGDLFVGFHNAFSYTNIYTLNHRMARVPLIFTSIQAEDRKISPINVSQITLQPGENTLNVEFAALDFSKPEKIQYAYWMEGADKQWHFTPQRSLSFTNLAGGNYMLHLKMMGPSGIISNEELTLAIKVIPQFYRTWWFWLLVLAGAGSLLYFYYHIRRQQRAKLEQIRNRIATDLHDDMGSTLSSIRIFSDVARNQLLNTQPQVVPMLEKISNNASQLSDNMQDIIWTIKQDHDKLEDLVARIREFGLKLCDAKDIIFKVHISDTFKTSRLDIEQRRNLYLIFKECLNNAIKYSGCTIIQLFITQQRGHLKMVIEDNGKGFHEKEVTRGNGLSNIRKRAMEINGTASIESAPGKGTRIDIMVNLG